MPSRIIRDGWVESPAIDQLDANAERFFIRLCLKADDFGRYHANPQLLKSNLFPLREDVRSADMSRCLAACENAGLLRCYDASGGRFLVIPKFGQRVKANTRSKFPAPPGDPPPNPDASGTIPESPGQSGTVPPYSDAYSKAEAEAGAFAPARMHIPDKLNTPEVRAELQTWAAYWAKRYNHSRELPIEIIEAHIKKVSHLTPIDAVAWMENARSKGLRDPCEPFEPRTAKPQRNDPPAERISAA